MMMHNTKTGTAPRTHAPFGVVARASLATGPVGAFGGTPALSAR
ncbi:hypothetical protein ACIGCK_10745 [Microbacterium sp. NPDC078428]|uniref:Uncharacterized protein n=1 Tax=Microbacterium limosum TaxID=3079935 RepID=A0AAU0MJT6_9MICO|nr:hypothetical protein [Microbacterium sp. Y20]WOQ70529.1 hypothetical protein RYJ27_04790 [Microbacterium sp. Y20]